MRTDLVTNAVRNEQGIWINSQVFREAGLHFMKNKYYCSDPKGSPSYKEYWDRELDRCVKGYTSGGVKITQHHYFYLNYCQIKIVKENADGSSVATKETKQPDFWDGDYNYFWAVEIAQNGLFSANSLVPSTQEEREEFWKLSLSPDFKSQENHDRRQILEEQVLKRLNLYFTIEVDWRDGGHHILVGKARRKGYSYKNAAMCANIYNTIKKSLTIIGAFDKKYLYPRGTMAMTSEYISFLNENTAWGKAREYVDREEHKKASFRKMIDDKPVESGYLSEVMAITFKDNPEAARGKDAVKILFEECGIFPNLKESIRKTADGLTAGKYITGQMIGFGTGGDMEYGTTDFADIFYHPKQDNFMPFYNIWDEDAGETSCSFFHPTTWNMEGYCDEQGNSDIQSATEWENSERTELIINSSSSDAIQQRVQEHPFNPAEAFLTVSMNDFPIVELRARLNKVKREDIHLKKGQPCYLIRKELNEADTINPETGEVKQGRKYKIVAEPDLSGILQPIWDYKPKIKDLSGAVVIYEHPVENTPKGLYKIGFDPYRQQNSSMTVPSLGVLYVYKTVYRGSFTKHVIVAQYVGRPYSPDDVNRVAELLAELYNAEIMFENEVTHVKDYFIRKKKVHLMSLQPDTVIAKATKNSKVARVWGCHMTDKLKDAGEKYIKQWLLEERDFDEFNSGVIGIDTLNDPALIEELILYNRKGNFDRVMAFMMIQLQLADEAEDKSYGGVDKSSNVNDLLEMMKTQYRNVNTAL